LRKEQQVVLSEPAPLAFDHQCLSLRGGGGGGGGGGGNTVVVYHVTGFRQSFKYFNHGPTAAALRKTLRFRNDSLVAYATSWLAAVNSSATGDDPLSTLRIGSKLMAAAAASAKSGGVSGGGSGGGGSSLRRRQVVGIHVRSGMAGGGSFGGCLPAEDYYLRAMNYYRYDTQT
jgi:hypothetical protein